MKTDKIWRELNQGECKVGKGVGISIRDTEAAECFSVEMIPDPTGALER